MCPDVLGSSESFIIGDGLHSLLTQALDRVLVLPQIELGADEDDRDVGGMVTDLGVPL